MPLTKEQFNALREKGLSVEQITAFDKGMDAKDLAFEKKKANEGLASKIFRGITEPVVTLAARPFQVAKAIGGATEEEQAINLPYYGKIKTATTGKDIVRDVGRGFETVSLGVGGTGLAAGRTLFGKSVASTVPKILQTPGVVQSVKTGLKGTVKEGVKSFAQTGLTSGGITGFGMGLEEASEKPPEEAFNTIFKNTAFGAASGLAGGTVLGAITPVAAKGLIKIADYTKVPQLTQKISNVYKRTLNPTGRQAKIDSRFGNDSFSFLAQELPEMPLSVNKDGRVVADDAIEMAKQKYQAEASAFKPIIRNSGKYISVDDAVANMKKMAKAELDGSDLKRAEAQIDSEVDSFISQTDPADVNVDVRGKRYISLARADDMKSYSWSRGKGWGTPEAELWTDTNNMIGHSLKDAIEDAIDYAPIKEMNRRLGQWKSAIDMLEKRNNLPSGTGGKMSRYIARSTGTLLGGGIGGGQEGGFDNLTGAGGGYITANMLAALFANPNVRLFAIRALLKNLQKAGKMDMIREAQQILQEQSIKYRLPAAGGSSYVETPIILPEKMPSGPTGREVELGLNEVRGMNQLIPKNSEAIAPSVAPTTKDSMNVIMPETIPQTKPKSIKPVDKSIQGGYIRNADKVDVQGFSKEIKSAQISPNKVKLIPKEIRNEALKLHDDLDKLSPEVVMYYENMAGAIDEFRSLVQSGGVGKEELTAARDIFNGLKNKKIRIVPRGTKKPSIQSKVKGLITSPLGVGAATTAALAAAAKLAANRKKTNKE